LETVSDIRGAMPGTSAGLESPVSAVSWAAIVAGTLVACSVSLILLALGSGLGLASVSPWAGRGASATTFTVMTAIWLVIVQWLASGLGGYLTGRLRTKWVRTHTHEVFFRDTAHGFVTWAAATVITAVVLASATTAAIGTGVEAVGNVAASAAQGAASSAVGSVDAYDVDTLFRSSRPDASSSAADARAEATRILTKSLAAGELASDDRTYLAQLIAARAGIPQEDAEKRLDQTTAQIKAADAKARQAADAARKAGAMASLYTALSLLVGAFIASVAAALGGSQRDEHT
jgi:hypothetical protein